MPLHRAAQRGAVEGLQVAVRPTLIGKEKGLPRGERLSQVADEPAGLDIRGQAAELFRIGHTPTCHVRGLGVDNLEFAHAFGDPRRGMIGRQGKGAAKIVQRLVIAVEFEQLLAAAIIRFRPVGRAFDGGVVIGKGVRVTAERR